MTYLNGDPVGGMDLKFEFDLDSQNDSVSFGIGAKYLTSYGESYDGKMDDLAVWDETLSQERIRELAAGVSPFSAASNDSMFPVVPLAEYRMDGNALDSGGQYSGLVLGGATFTNGV